MDKRLFVGLFVLVQAMWAGSYVVGHFVVQEFDPFITVQLRYTLATVTLLPLLVLLLRRQQPDFRDLRWWGHVLLVAVTSGVIYQVLFFSALRHVSPTTVALIYALNPFFTAFGEILFLKQRRLPRFYLGFVIASAGAFWVIFARGGRIDFSHLGVGELIALAAALMWSTYTLLARGTKKPDWNPLWISGFSYAFIALFMLPKTGITPLAETLGAASNATWIGMLYIAVVSTAFAHTMFYVSVQKLGASISATFTYLVPSFAAVFEFLFLRSQFTLDMAVGTVLVVSGLIVGTAKRPAEAKRPAVGLKG